MFSDGALLSSPWFTYAILPLLIFISRVVDVSMETIRVIFVARGMKFLASILGFFELIIWLVAIVQIMNNLNSPLCYIAYAAGFATGTYIGIWIEGKLAIGAVSLRVITKKGADELIEELRGNNFGVTSILAEGSSGQVSVIYMLVTRHDLNAVIKKVKQFNPQAFYFVEDVRFVSEGIFPPKTPKRLPNMKIRRLNKKRR